jgi:hypothetical protein
MLLHVYIPATIDKLPSDGIAVLVCMADEETMLQVLRRFNTSEPERTAYERVPDGEDG